MILKRLHSKIKRDEPAEKRVRLRIACEMFVYTDKMQKEMQKNTAKTIENVLTNCNENAIM